jgi:hypothetical protein
MTKAEEGWPSLFLSLGLRHCFVISLSDFVITAVLVYQGHR